MRAALNIYISSELPNTQADGRGIRHKPNKAISNVDYRGTRLKQWQGIDITNLVPANTQNLEVAGFFFALGSSRTSSSFYRNLF